MLKKNRDIADIILSKFNESNNDAYEFIFKSFYKKLCYFADNIIRNETASQDIVQDIFVKLWQRDNSFETYDQLSAFLYVAVKNSCFNFLKQKKNHNIDLNIVDNEVLQTDKESSVIDDIISAEIISVVSEAINTLPAECAKIMNLLMKGYSMVEISLILDLATSSVRTQKARAIKLLKIKMTRKLFMALLVLVK